MTLRVGKRGIVLAALRSADPERWRSLVRAGLREHGGNVRATAEALGIARATLIRWIDGEARLTEGIELRKPGRPWPAAE